MATCLKTLIVDDTITYRTIVRQIVGELPMAEVAGTAKHGQEALDFLKGNAIDIVLLDVEMPVMDGLETLQNIKKLYPRIGVIMISGANRHSADITIKALEAGAMDFVPKPDADSMTSNVQALKDELAPLFELYLAQQKTPLKPLSVPTPPVSKPILNQRFTFEVLTIGVSTGGPNALNEFIPNLPENLGVPILLVQHMPPVFTASLANSLNKKSKLQVKEAEDGEQLKRNTVYIAPGGFHMTVTPNKTIALNTDPLENSCRPAVDVLFRSVGQVYKKNILAVVMTGMGSDGAKGMKVLKETNSCYCITQSEPTCVVYGMPKSVDDLRLSDESVPLNDLASRIASLLQSGVLAS